MKCEQISQLCEQVGSILCDEVGEEEEEEMILEQSIRRTGSGSDKIGDATAAFC